MKTILPAVLALLLADLAQAEGAVRVLACEVTEVCDADGACTAANEAIEFRLEPGSLDADGAGDYRIRYGEVSASMQARSFAGPFLWTRESEQNTLMANSDSAFLWHQLTLGAAPVATVRWLRCSLTQ